MVEGSTTDFPSGVNIGLTPLFAVGLVVGPVSVGLADALLGAHDLPAGAARVDGPVAQVPPSLVHLAVPGVQQVLALVVWGGCNEGS